MVHRADRTKDSMQYHQAKGGEGRGGDCAFVHVGQAATPTEKLQAPTSTTHHRSVYFDHACNRGMKAPPLWGDLGRSRAYFLVPRVGISYACNANPSHRCGFLSCSCAQKNCFASVR
jgi:hypothetical protein